eukprot:452301_1
MLISEYFLGPDPLIFTAAESYCSVSQSSHLASIHSNTSFYAARSLCQSVTNPEACWIGLQRVGVTNTWNNIDGTTVDFGFDVNGTALQGQTPPWISGEPGNTEPCIEFLGTSSGSFWDFYWNDRRCDHANYPICNCKNTSTQTPMTSSQLPHTTQSIASHPQTSNIDTTNTSQATSVSNILSFLPAVSLTYLVAIGVAVLFIVMLLICICVCCCNKRIKKKNANKSDEYPHDVNKYNAVRKESDALDGDKDVVRVDMARMDKVEEGEQSNVSEHQSISSHESMYTDRYNTRKDGDSEQYGVTFVRDTLKKYDKRRKINK